MIQNNRFPNLTLNFIDKFQNTVFGTQKVEEILLCAMESHHKPLTEDGFWQIEDVFPLNQ